MITKEQVKQVVENSIDPQSQFIVEVAIKPGNKIQVSVDSFSGITIDHCIAISRKIEAHFNRDVEDYELEVASAGLSQPFKVFQQYQKNIGKKVEVLLKTGEKLKAKLVSAVSNGLSVETEKKAIVNGSKKKQLITEEQFIEFENIKSTTLVIEF